MDVHMPRLDGIQATRAIRRFEQQQLQQKQYHRRQQQQQQQQQQQLSSNSTATHSPSATQSTAATTLSTPTHVPIYALTAGGTEEEKNECLASGMVSTTYHLNIPSFVHLLCL